MTIWVAVYLALGYWAAGKTIFANSVRVGSFSAIIIQQATVGFLLGFILIPVALLKTFFKR